MGDTQIRLAQKNELRRIIELENLAGRRYADAGLPADLEGIAYDLVSQAQANELLWVVVDAGEPLGFALCWEQPEASPQFSSANGVFQSNMRARSWCCCRMFW